MSAEDTIEQLMSKLGADIIVKLKPHLSLTSQELAAKRLAVCKQLLKTNAEVELPGWPMYKGVHQSAKVVVVWDRPVPWAAPHRRLLRNTLQAAGIHDDQVGHVWAWPFVQRDQPVESQVLSYLPITDNTIDAMNARYVLLVGALPTRLWRKEPKLNLLLGHSGVWKGRWIVYPTLNPYSIMRDPALTGEWRMQLFDLIDMINNGEEFRLNTRCITKDCTEGVFMYDPDGIGWCKRHHQAGMRKRDNKVHDQAKKVNKLQVPQMFPDDPTT